MLGAKAFWTGVQFSRCIKRNPKLAGIYLGTEKEEEEEQNPQRNEVKLDLECSFLIARARREALRFHLGGERGVECSRMKASDRSGKAVAPELVQP